MISFLGEIWTDRSVSQLTKEVLQLALQEKDEITAISDIAVALQWLRIRRDESLMPTRAAYATTAGRMNAPIPVH